jgi:flagellar biosynthesis chaperone FliJ
MTDHDSDFLVAVESKCDWLAYDARQMTHFMTKIQHRRDFLTKLEAGFDKAEQELKDALRTVQDARKHYLAKETA